MLKRRVIFSEKKPWFFNDESLVPLWVLLLYQLMLLFVQCDKWFSSVHDKRKEDISLYTLLYLIENLHSV